MNTVVFCPVQYNLARHLRDIVIHSHGSILGAVGNLYCILLYKINKYSLNSTHRSPDIQRNTNVWREPNQIDYLPRRNAAVFN